LAQLAAISAIERIARNPSGSTGSFRFTQVATAGALASLSFLLRSFGVGLVIGAMIYLFKERLAKQALVFAAVVAMLVGPWTFYSRVHAPTAEQRVEQGGSIVLPYTVQFWHRVAGQPRSGTMGIADLPGRVWDNLVEIGKVDLGAFVSYSS